MYIISISVCHIHTTYMLYYAHSGSRSGICWTLRQTFCVSFVLPSGSSDLPWSSCRSDILPSCHMNAVLFDLSMCSKRPGMCRKEGTIDSWHFMAFHGISCFPAIKSIVRPIVPFWHCLPRYQQESNQYHLGQRQHASAMAIMVTICSKANRALIHVWTAARPMHRGCNGWTVFQSV